MNKAKWLLASGVLALSGIAFGAKVDPCAPDPNDPSKPVDRVQCDKLRAKKEVKKAREKTAGATEKAGKKVEKKAKEVGKGIGGASMEGAEAIRGNVSALDRGQLSDGRMVKNSITTNPLGLIFGDGLNLQISHSLFPKFSVVAGARYSRTRSDIGALTQFGLQGGVDWYLIGQNNEGLRIGPRLDLAWGADSVAHQASGFGGVGLAGELGYDWIASRGVTLGLAGGLRGEVGSGTNSNVPAPFGGTTRNFGPYGKLNVGYSW